MSKKKKFACSHASNKINIQWQLNFDNLACEIFTTQCEILVGKKLLWILQNKGFPLKFSSWKLMYCRYGQLGFRSMCYYGRGHLWASDPMDLYFTLSSIGMAITTRVFYLKYSTRV